LVPEVKRHAAELFHRGDTMFTDLTCRAKKDIRFSNRRGTVDQWIRVGKHAVRRTMLSCWRVKENEALLYLFALTYDLANSPRQLALPRSIRGWILTTLRANRSPTMARFIPDRNNVALSLDPAVPALMVPEHGLALVRLVGGNKHTLTLTNTGTSAAEPASIIGDEVERDGIRTIVFQGDAAGSARLSAKSPSGSDEAVLEIDVLAERTVGTKYYVLSDEAGHHSRRTGAEAVQLHLEAGNIHNPQDNVIFVLQGTRDVQLKGDRGAVPKTSALRPLLDGLFGASPEGPKLERCEALLHVFFIWALDDDDGVPPSGTRILGVTWKSNNIVVVKDFPGKAGPVLAHEFGHFLATGTNADHKTKQANLMFGDDRHGIFLDRDQRLTMNGKAGSGLLHPACELPIPEGLLR
jgi:hypothetical protein